MSTPVGTPTPRTDKAGTHYDILNLCRQLERELTALRAAHEVAQSTLSTLIEAHNNLRADYTKARSECDALRKSFNEPVAAKDRKAAAEIWRDINNRNESLATRIFNLWAQNDKLEVENAALREDADRYRWLRDKSAKHVIPSPSATMNDGHGIKVIWQSYGVDSRTQPRCALFSEALDTAIDAARKP